MVPVHLNSVTKQFDTGAGVLDVTSTIEPGEFFTLLGPSGCGKTTTLRMIAGFTFPTTGTIRFSDTDVTFLPPNKRETGMVFQNYALFPHMTVFENVAFGLKVRKIPSSDLKIRVDKALQQVRLQGLGGRKIGQLSGGQQQRVALARAIVIEPKILLLDEPLSNLDAKLREETRIQIRELQKSLGLTTIYVTHDQGEAMTVSDRIMVMSEGRVQQIAKPHDLYMRPANRLVATFVGETNLLKAVVSSFDSLSVVLQIENWLRVIASRNQANQNITYREGGTVYISIRPEGINLTSYINRKDTGIVGEVQTVEFGGMHTFYTLKVGGVILRVASTNSIEQTWEVGQFLTISIPINSIFIVEQGD